MAGFISCCGGDCPIKNLRQLFCSYLLNFVREKGNQAGKVSAPQQLLSVTLIIQSMFIKN